MFIIFFSLFIFLFTVIENWKISAIVAWLSIITILIIFFFFKKVKISHIYKSIGVVVLSFFLVFWSYVFYNYRTKTQSLPSVFIGDGQITSVIWQGKYTLNDGIYEYYVSSQKEHNLWDELWFVGNFSKQQTISGFFYSWFNQTKRLKMKGYAGMLYENNSILLSWQSSSGFLFSLKNSLRQKVLQTYIQGTTGQNNQTSALILWMLIGDKSVFSKEDYQLFIDSWLVHLVAVSGGNIVMIVTFLMFILFFVPFYPRLVIILFVVIGYGIICGMDSSVLRAVIMGAMSLIALLWWRRTSTRRLLGIAYISMLCYNPYFLVYDVGFLLSFGAVIGIMLSDLSKEKETSTKPSSFIAKIGQKIRKEYLKPTLGATLWISPLMIFFMGKINLIWILGNLFVLPLVPIIMIGWLIGIWLPWWIWQLVLWWEMQLVNWVFIVSKKLSEYGLYLLVDAPWIKYSILIVSVLIIFGHQYLANLTKKGSTSAKTTLTTKDSTRSEIDKLL